MSAKGAMHRYSLADETRVPLGQSMDPFAERPKALPGFQALAANDGGMVAMSRPRGLSDQTPF